MRLLERFHTFSTSSGLELQYGLFKVGAMNDPCLYLDLYSILSGVFGTFNGLFSKTGVWGGLGVDTDGESYFAPIGGDEGIDFEVVELLSNIVKKQTLH